MNSESGKHYNHPIVQLFDNNDSKGLKRNVELYKQLLMNDINIIKNKINKCNSINNNKVDMTVYKKILLEKVLLIGKLLYKINEIQEDFQVKFEINKWEQKINPTSGKPEMIFEVDVLSEISKKNEYKKRI